MIGKLSNSSLKSKAYSKSMLVGNTAYYASDYELISTALVTSDTTSVTFSSIPNTYKHLQIRLAARTTAAAEADAIIFTFNSDAGANYAFHQITQLNTGATSSSGVTSNTYGLATNITGANATAGSFGSCIVDIFDYKQVSKNKTATSLGGLNSATYQLLKLISSLWVNASAITTINLAPASSSNNLVAGSRFSLYGIKG